MSELCHNTDNVAVEVFTLFIFKVSGNIDIFRTERIKF